jgi:fatty-acyl-CoA synthase
LLGCPGVKEANVYGVEVTGAEGRAGMAGLVVGPEFDIKVFSDGVAHELPSYAQPLFVRILPELETTGTFKTRKMDLVADGFDPGKIKGPLYFHDARKGYVKVTKGLFEKIAAGAVKL